MLKHDSSSKPIAMTLVEKFAKWTDTEVLERIISGEAALYEVIIRRYNPYLFKIGRSYGFGQMDTEDLIQDCFLNAYASLRSFRGNSSLKTWLVKIMLHQCYQRKRKSSFKNEIPSEDIEKSNRTPMFTQDHNDTSRRVVIGELKHILEDALLQIPEEYRMVFTLRDLNGLSTRETAEVLEISEANAKVRLNRAKHLLRKEIEKSYSPEDIFEFNLVYCNRIVDQVFRQLPDMEADQTGEENKKSGWLSNLRPLSFLFSKNGK